jgi:hypothetical protein
MVRILFILLVLIIGIAFAISYIKRFVNKFKNIFIPDLSNGEKTGKEEGGQVVYKKDDVVVLKGDAGKNKN